MVRFEQESVEEVDRPDHLMYLGELMLAFISPHENFR